MTTEHDKPEVSIIIPTYNHAHFLKRCLSSVVNQTFSNWEAIVVNNYSRDNTIEVVGGFFDQRIKLINFNNNGIIGASRNKGIELARGDYIAFLDSDDFWYKDKLVMSLKYLNNADIVFHTLDVYTGKGKCFFRKSQSRHLKTPVFVDLMVNGNALSNSSVVVKKRIISEVGGFSEEESFIATEDYDLWLRMARVTEKFICIPKTLGAYWMDGGNVTEVSERHIIRIEAVYDRHLMFLNEEEKERAQMYKCYLIGRIKQKMGLSEEAKELFRFSRESGNLKIKLKSFLLEKWLKWQK